MLSLIVMYNVSPPRKPAQQTILIVEAHERMRAGLYDWFSAAFAEQRCLVVQSREQALEAAAAQPPDVTLIDAGLPYTQGMETAKSLKTIAPDTHIVIISIYEEPDYRASARSAGASAYVSKQRILNDLVPIVRELLNYPSPGGGKVE